MARSGSDSSFFRSSLLFAVSLCGLFGGTALLAYYAVLEWMQPATPLVLAGTALFLPVAALNLVVGLVSSDPDESLGEAIRGPVFASLVVGIVAAAAAASWLWPEVRAVGLEQADERAWHDTTARALRDPDPEIVAGACEAMFRREEERYREQLLDLLDQRPRLAEACLRRARETPRAGAYARLLSERWHRELLEQTHEIGRRCRLSESLGELPGASTAGIPALLSCSFNARLEEVRTCCARTVAESVGTGEELANALGASMARTISERLAAPLVQASLHQLQFAKTNRERADRLRLQNPEMQRYAAAMGCAHLRNAARPSEMVNQFAAWLDDQSCSTSIPEPRSNVRAWRRVCEHIDSERSRTDRPERLVCKAVRAHSLRSSVARARTILESSAAGAKRQFMEADIVAGTALKQGTLPGPLRTLGTMAGRGADRHEIMQRVLRRMDEDEAREAIEKIVMARRGETRFGLSSGPDSPTDDSQETNDRNEDDLDENSRNQRDEVLRKLREKTKQFRGEETPGGRGLR